MEHPKATGDRTTLAVMLAVREAGYTMAIPFGENTRYDLLIDDGAMISRVQCKTGRLRRGAIRFNTCSSYAHRRNPRANHRDYAGEIDYFGIYCRELGRVYLVPIAEVKPRQRASLRVDQPKNNQRSLVRFACDYEIGVVSSVGAG